MKYDVNWKGLDQGVEHTWTPEVLVTGLRVIGKFQPVEHRNPNSPFYDAIESEFPDKTWRAFDSHDGSFRPIFRRSNTWKKLGLITELEKEFSVSFTGKKLLNGDISLNEIYANICSNHDEDGEKPFVILATLLISIGLDEFTPDDVLFILHYWRPGEGECPTDIKRRYLQLDADYTESEAYKTRRRRINAMLKLLMSMGAVQKAGKFFIIGDKDLLLEIAGEGQITGFEQGLESEILLDAVDAKRVAVTSKREVKLDRTVAEFTSLAAKESDPLQRLKLLERATRKHEATIESFTVSVASQYGLKSYENTSGYDIFTQIDDTRGLLVEVKTVTPRNISKQIREAVSQLYEYKFRFKDELSLNVKLVILLDQDPKDFIPDWIYDYLANDRNISLWWVDNEEVMVAQLSQSLPDLLNDN